MNVFSSFPFPDLCADGASSIRHSYKNGTAVELCALGCFRHILIDGSTLNGFSKRCIHACVCMRTIVVCACETDGGGEKWLAEGFSA